MGPDEDLLGGYERWLKSWTSSEATVRSRVRLARSRMKEWGPPETWTADELQAFLARDLKPWSRSTYYNNLKDFCGWLVADGRLSSSPMEGIRKHSSPKSLPRPLSEAEVERVLAAASDRQRAWLLLALLAGLRAHEIAKIRGEDIDERGLFVNGKGGKAATLPVHPQLWQLAQTYPRSGYWFPRGDTHITPATVSQSVARLFRSLGISHGSIHRCRHVFGTRLLRSGVHVRRVQKLMRHESLESTAIYTAVDEDELQAAINLLSA